MGLDYYRILEVNRDASEQDIKHAYRRLALQWHPDKQVGERKHEAETKFKLLSEAYEVLRDPQKRSVFNRFGEEGLRRGFSDGPFSTDEPTFVFRDPEEIFRSFFGGFDPFPAVFSRRADFTNSFFGEAPFEEDPFLNQGLFPGAGRSLNGESMRSVSIEVINGRRTKTTTVQDTQGNITVTAELPDGSTITTINGIPQDARLIR